MTVYLNRKFDDLPWFKPIPCPMSDSDIEFHSDMQYLRALRTEIVDGLISGGRTSLLPSDFDDNIAWACHQLQTVNTSVVSNMMAAWREGTL